MMSGSDKYPAPVVPQTPSATINKMLEARCGHSFNSPIKYGIAMYICMVFQAITSVYGFINQKKPAPSHTFWMASCGIVSVLLILKSFLIYQIIMASAILLAFVLRWGFTILALAGAGLGVSGMVFFDKEGVEEQPPKYTPAPPSYSGDDKAE